MQRAAKFIRPAVMPLAYTALTLLVFWYLWTGIDGAARTFKYDPLHQYWADLSLFYESFARGEMPLWNPFDRGGFPIYGDPQPGLLYPGNWPLWTWGAVAGHVSYTLMEVKVVAHWIFGAIGMHLLLRRRGCPEQACYVGGSIMSLSAPAIRYGGNALNWTYAWIPWVLLAIDWYAQRPTVRRAIVLGSTVGMCLLSGAAAVFHYMLLLAVPYGIYVMWGRIKSSLPTLAIAVGVFVLWTAATIASSLEVVPETVRTARDLSFVTHSAYGFGHLINFFVPRIEGELTYYGLLPLAAFGLWLAARMDRLALIIAGVVAGSVLLAIGDNANFLASIASFLENFTLFRQAHRYLYITSVAMAFGGALGLAWVMRLSERDRKRELASRVTKVLAAICFLIGLGWILTVVLQPNLRNAKASAFGLAAMTAVIYTWLLRALLLSTGRRRNVYAWIAVAVVALDLWAVNAQSHYMGVGPKPDLSADKLLDELDGVRDLRYRIYDRGVMQYRVGARQHVRDLGGYENDPLALSRYTKFLGAVRRRMRSLGHANVRYYLDGNNVRPPLKPKPGDKFEQLEPGVYELPSVAPAVMYVPRPVVAKNADDAVAKIAAIVPGEGAVVEAERPVFGRGDGTGAGRIVERSMNRLVAEIATPDAGLVVIAEAYDSVWTATVDGKPADIVPANIMFRGVFVDGAGQHRIVMEFSPARFWYLLPLWIAGVLLLCWVVVLEIRDRRRNA